jgi:membrane glycosyltransferase
MRGRRWAFAALVSATTMLGSLMMLDIVRDAGITALEVGILTLFVPTFGWIAVSFWNAIVGFALGLLRRDPLSLRPLDTSGQRVVELDGSSTGCAGVDGTLSARTALVMPAHNEDPELIMAGLASMMRSLEKTGEADSFDFHLLSDTTDAATAHEEEAAWRALRADAARPHRLHYRRRPENKGRKTGNIAEFCARCEREYDFVVVLDADSVMGGATIVELVRIMEANPRAGLLQTVPLPARQETLFGRFVQFAAALYGPMLAAGQSFWQGDAANYWGHNAIIRLQPFAEHCRLPVLRGRPPLGGPVLSHDFVEAALIRRAGWGVYLLSGLGGSWEGVPANVPDFAKRDRRWAQGSIQHLRLLGMPGLHPLARVHFVMGAMGYLSSVLWLLMLLASTAYVLAPPASVPVLVEPVPGGALERALASLAATAVLPLLSVTAMILFLPKALGLLLAGVRRRTDFGGVVRLVTGGVVETMFSVVLAPLMMLYHTRFVLGILTGHDVAWAPQQREDRAVGWREAMTATAGSTVLAAGWAGITLTQAPSFFLWLTPIFAGTLLGAPLVRWTSSVGLGRAAARVGLLTTPAEVLTPAELGRVDAAAQVGRPGRAGHMFLAQPGRAPKRTPTVGMYEAERGLFDLQRGRPVLITSPASATERPVLAAAVEGLGEETLRTLHQLGCGPVRLILTGHRAAAMGVRADTGEPTRTAVSVGLNGETAAEVLRLATSPVAVDLESLPVRDAGAGERAGLALTRLARMLPAAIATETDIDSVPDLATAVAGRTILGVTAEQVADLAGASDTRVEVTYVSDATVPLEQAEHVRFMLFREANGLTEHVAILIGEPDAWPDPVPVRLHSACLTGDLFGSLRCDCGEQLRRSLRLFGDAGGGVLLYLEQEGRGIGLGNKLRAYSLQQEGLDTVDADCVLGFGADERRYHGAVGILRHLGVDRVQLLTNNPEKLHALEEGGIRVVHRTPLHGTLTRHNLPYVRAKVQRAGHWLGDMLHQSLNGD